MRRGTAYRGYPLMIDLRAWCQEAFHRLQNPPQVGDREDLPPARIFLIRVHQILVAISRDLMDGGLTLRTTSLVYTTLLSLVPLLAFSFAVLKGFGIHNQMEPWVLQFLEPLGPQREEFADRILGFVEKIEVGVLGAVGLGFLMITVGSLIYKIETGFNYIWQIQESRHWPRSLGGYLSVILGGPVLLFTASGMANAVLEWGPFRTLTNQEPFQTLVFVLGHILPTLLVIAAGAFIYRLIPNTRVSLRAALVGGVVAGLLWQGCGWVFGAFIGTSTRYTAIYSSFAIGLLFMIWLYVIWLILLVGGRIAFYVQSPQYLDQPRLDELLVGPERERAGLTVLCLVAEAFLRGRERWTLPELERRLVLPRRPLQGMLGDLEAVGLIAATRGPPPAYLPAGDPDRVLVKEAFEAIRQARGQGPEGVLRIPAHPAAEAIMEELEIGLGDQLGNATLASFLEPEEERGKKPKRRSSRSPT